MPTKVCRGMEVLLPMRRRDFNKSLAAAAAAILTPLPRIRNASAATTSGATLVFGYPNGFAGASNAIHLANDATFSGSVIRLINNGGHQSAAAWYMSRQAPNSFTTQFTFQPSGLGLGPAQSGMTFCLQNTAPPLADASEFGTTYAG